ncbi:MAG: TetR/AcrR family transcriptional regulator, partial [Haliscomenobacter sp.]
MEPQQQILEKAEGLFMRLGVKSVSMDDVARELGISKKTLYQYFPTKEDLIVRT